MATKVTLGGKLIFPSEYLAAIEFKGKDVALTIKEIKVQELKMAGGKVDVKPVVFFEETEKKLILNKTNAASIAELYGTEASKWVGKRVKLYPSRTQCGAEMVDCIRVRNEEPAPKKESE